MLYQIFGPNEVEEHSTQGEYVRSEFERTQRAYPLKRVEIVLAQLGDGAGDREARERITNLLIRKDTAVGPEVREINKELDRIADTLHPDMISRHLEGEYDKINKSRRWARMLTFTLYLSATFIVLWLLGQRTYAVFMYGWEKPNMLVETRMMPRVPSRTLEFVVFTADDAEWQRLEAVFAEAQIISAPSPIPPRDDRPGRKYILDETQISNLERVLQGNFDNVGMFTAAGGAGANYKCEEMTRGGPGKGCENLQATGQGAATVSCGLVARNKKWFGGSASPGYCRGP